MNQKTFFIFRSPSRMAISRSYPRHLVKFREKKSILPLFFKEDATFYSSHIFSFKKTYFLLIHIIFFILPVIHPNIRPVICPIICPPVIRLQLSALCYPLPVIHLRLSAYGYRPPSYPPSYLMLPNLTNQFIKFSNGDLQWEWNSDFWIRYHQGP